jgi:hypothetical protein
MSLTKMALDQGHGVRLVCREVEDLWHALLADPAGISKEAYGHLSMLCHYSGAGHPAAGDVCMRDGRVYYQTEEV